MGWYHSHPVFEVNPSNIDVSNHSFQQKIFEAEDKPFVALIIGPYNDNSLSEDIQLNCFHLNSNDNKPYQLRFKTVPQVKISKYTIDWIFMEIERSKSAKDQVNLWEAWRPGVSKFEKLQKCLESMFFWNLHEYTSFDPLDGLEHTNLDDYFPKGSKDLFSFLRTYIKENESESSAQGGEESSEFIEIETIDIGCKESITDLFTKIIYSLM